MTVSGNTWPILLPGIQRPFQRAPWSFQLSGAAAISTRSWPFASIQVTVYAIKVISGGFKVTDVDALISDWCQVIIKTGVQMLQGGGTRLLVSTNPWVCAMTRCVDRMFEEVKVIMKNSIIIDMKISCWKVNKEKPAIKESCDLNDLIRL